MKKVIVLMGFRGAGKDTLANALSDEWQQIAFAKELKNKCNELFPWMEKDYPPETKDLPLPNCPWTPREIWNKLNILSEIDPYIFVNSVDKFIKSSNKTKFIITDLRKPAEYAYVKHNNYPIVYIDDCYNKKIIEEKLKDNPMDKYITTFKYDYLFTNYKTESSKIEFSEFINTL